MIVNHNAGWLLFDCLRSALSQAAEVVLVDNASDPRLFEQVLARLGAQPRLHVIRAAENRGFAVGCNLGARRSTQPLVLLLNPDCVLGPGSLARLCTAIGRQPRTAMVGGLLTYADGREQGGGRRAVPTPWRSFVRAFGLARLSRRWPKLFDDFHLHKQPLPASPLPVEAISGACMLVSREAIAEIGLMDEGYFLHCEDLDLCMRARGRGWQILFVPDAPIVHFKGGCSRERPVFVEWHKHKGMVRFYQKHFRHQYPAGLMELVVISVWLRFAAIATKCLAVGLRDRVRRAAGMRRTDWFSAARPLAGGASGSRSTRDTAGLSLAVSTHPLTS